MSVITELNSAPYFDDYSPEKLNSAGIPEVDKDFLRILFRPGYAVQTRELNQLQSILQMQVERFGKHIFKEGSIVIGGLTTIDTQTAKYLTIETNYNSYEVLVASAKNKVITGTVSHDGVYAKGLVTVVADADNTEPKTLIYKPLNGYPFETGETISVEGLGNYATIRSATFTGNDSATHNAIGDSSTVSIDEGIFFSKGTFVINAKQTVHLDKYSKTPDKLAGLLSSVSIIDETVDETLLDNASGSYNYAAPGAHRLKINLTLTSKDTNYNEDVNKFIQLLEVRDGKLYKQISRPTYNMLAKLLARRTFDESGDYTVTPFLLNIESYKGATGSVLGRLSVGKAYVKGFEVETIATQDIDIPKARTTENYIGADAPINYGNFVTVRSVSSLPNINLFERLYLYDQDGATGPIGFARVRDIQFNGAFGPNYKLSLFDTTITSPSKTFGNVLYMATGATGLNYTGSEKKFQLFGNTGATGMGLQNPEVTTLVFNTGYTAVKELTNIQLTYRKNYNSVTVAGNIATIQSGSSRERFQGGAGATVTASEALQYGYIITNATTGAQLTNFTITLNSPGSGSQQTATITFSASQSNPVNIIAVINNNDASPNTKTEKNNEFTEGYIQANANSTSTVTVPSYVTSARVNTTPGNPLFKIVSGPNASETTYAISSFAGNTITLTTPIPAVTTGDYFKISPYFAAATSYTSSARGIVYVKPTTLGSSISTTTTKSVTLAAGTITNASVIKVDNEQMFVVSGGGTTSVTVIRGYNGTTAATHSSGAVVYLQEIGLNVPDVTRVNKVLASTTDPVMNDWFNNSKNAAKDWILDNGQRHNYYDIASLKLISGKTPTTDAFVVFFDYLAHGVNDGFFCANSYQNKDIPYFYNDSANKQINLINSIDCRPTKTNPTTFTSTTLVSANTNFGFNSEYYLPRIDKIAVSVDGAFIDIQGIPSVTPKAPKDINDGMTLYHLYIPAYTYTPSSIRTKFIENKRYTMRDIGKIEKRIENIEYYTALSSLEQSTSLFDIKDSAGFDRFKNGFIVDSFIGHNVGDPTNPDYHCSIDIENQELRPEFRQKVYSLYLKTADSSNYQERGGLITKNFTDVIFINQPLASRSVNVNPFSVFAWWGNLELTPNNDFWKDTRAVPADVNNPDGLLDNVTVGGVPFGTMFNQWNNMWFGTDDVVTGFETQEIPSQEVPGGWVDIAITDTTGSSSVGITMSGRPGDPPIIIAIDPNGTTQTVQRQQLPPTIIPARTVEVPIIEQVRVPIPPPINLTTVSSGEIIRDVNMSEFIRPRRISFSATGMKPDTLVYPFFDGKLVSVFVTPSGGTIGGTLRTNSVGSISGTFNIPFGQFFVGDRIFLLSDAKNANDTPNRSLETTSAESRYKAEGLELTTTTLNIPVALPDPNSPFWGQQGLSLGQPNPGAPGQNFVNVAPAARVVDPLAETFFVDPVIYPEGLFISKVDLFFKTKDSNIPLIVQIRETVNGYPSSTAVLSSTTVPAANVNTSENATTPTTVTFPHVVFLRPGEYAIVLIANSNNYEAWVAQIGEQQVETTKIISEQPYVGSLFKSQNASTWTAEQTQDLMFKLYRCSFVTGTMTTVFTDWDATAGDNVITIPTDKNKPTNGSTGFDPGGSGVVDATNRTININFHPYKNGSKVTYTGSTGFLGVPYGDYYVHRMNSDTIKLYYNEADSLIGGATGLVPIVPESTPGKSNVFSNGARVLYLNNVFLNYIVPDSSVSLPTYINNGSTLEDSNIFEDTAVLSQDVIKTIPGATGITFNRKLEGVGLADVFMVPAGYFNPFSSATVTLYAKGATGALDPTYSTIVPNKNIEYNYQHNISASAESFLTKIEAKVTNENVSPVINASRQSVCQIENIINYDDTGETGVSGGNARSKYITRNVRLLNDSTYAKVFLTVNRPSGSNIRVYYKIKSSSDSESIEQKSWISMVQNTPDSSNFSPSSTEFIEYTFLPSTDAEYTKTTFAGTKMIYKAGEATYEDFVEIKFKIVMTSDNTCHVPRIADFRAIVLE